MRQWPTCLKSAAPGSFVSHLPDQQGSALVVVMGFLLIFTLVIVGIAGQIRAQLRATVLDREVAKAQTFDATVLQYEAMKFQNELTASAGDTTGVMSLIQGTPPANCTPQNEGLEFHHCAMRFPGVLGVRFDTTDYPLWQVPVKIQWLRTATDTRSSQGWLIVYYQPADTQNPGPEVVYVLQDRTWCKPNPDWVNDSTLTVCKPGG